MTIESMFLTKNQFRRLNELVQRLCGESILGSALNEILSSEKEGEFLCNVFNAEQMRCLVKLQKSFSVLYYAIDD